MNIRKTITSTVMAVGLGMSSLAAAPGAVAAESDASRSLVLAERVFTAANPGETYAALPQLDQVIIDQYLTD